MSKWDLPKEPKFYEWESPITKVYGDMHNEIIRQDEENYICAIEQAIGYRVDKDELIKALQYDREQYDKGYKDGVRETFIEELKKIKEEIEEQSNRNFYENGWWTYVSSVLDKHISELKGENNADTDRV